MSMPVVSVIMPAYNAARYIRECIESIIKQNFTDWELVVVDDGSTDGTLAICRECAAACDRIRVISQENRGVSAARNAGLESAVGEYVMFVDADDILPVHALTVFHGAVMRYPQVDIVRGEYEAVDDAGRVLFSSNKKVFNKRRLYHERDVNKFYRRYVGTDCFLWMMWIRRACIAGTRFVEGRAYMEDAEFLFSIMHGLQSCVYVPEIVYRYRKYGAAASAELNEKKINDVLGVAVRLADMAKHGSSNMDAGSISYAVNHCWNLVFGYLSERTPANRDAICGRLCLKARAVECAGGISSPSADIRDFACGYGGFYDAFIRRRKMRDMLSTPHRIVSFLKSVF